MKCVADIDAAIQASGFAEAEILREAMLGPRFLYNIRTGYRSLTPRTVQRIKDALRELRRRQEMLAKGRRGDGAEPWRSYSAAQYRLAVALVSLTADVSPSCILAADPFRRATADQEWLRAANLRRVALYIANQYLGVQQADLARAADMSKANVCVAMKAIEDMRGQPELERVLAHVEEAFR